MAEDIHQQYRERLVRATQQGQLVEFVGELKEEGVTQTQIFDLLEKYRYELDQQGRMIEADYLIEVSDRVWGFCFNDQRLFETSLNRFTYPEEPARPIRKGKEDSGKRDGQK